MKTTITLKLFPLIALTAVSGVIVAQPAQAMQPNPAANGFHPAVILTRPIQNALVARAPLAPPPRQHEAVKEAGDKVRVHGQLAAPRRQEMVKEATEKAHAPAHQAALARPETVDKAGKPALGMLVKSTATLTASKMILVGSKASRFDEAPPSDPPSDPPQGGGGGTGGGTDPVKVLRQIAALFPAKTVVGEWGRNQDLLAGKDLAVDVARLFPEKTVVGEMGRGQWSKAFTDLRHDMTSPSYTVAGKIERGDVLGGLKDLAHDLCFWCKK